MGGKNKTSVMLRVKECHHTTDGTIDNEGGRKTEFSEGHRAGETYCGGKEQDVNGLIDKTIKHE